jgi:hypothetical protein
MALTESLAYPVPLLGTYFFVDLPSGSGYPLGTPAGTVDQGIVYWNGTTWSTSPPIFVGGSPPNVTVTPSGTLAATTLSYNPLGLSVVSTSDNAADLTGNGTNIPSLVVIDQLYGGSNINDGRNGLSVFTDLISPTSPSNAYRFYVGISAYSKAQVSDNGTGGSPQGIVEAITGSAQLNAGATNFFAVIGGEFTISADAGSSVARKAIILLDNWPSDRVQGSLIDAHIWSTAHAGGPGSKTWATLDDDSTVFPISTGGTLIKLAAALSSPSIGTGLDFGGILVTGNVMQWSSGGFFIGGTASPTCHLPQATFVNSAGGVALTAVGGANEYSMQVSGSTTSGQSFGLKIDAGTNSSDFALVVQNAAGGANFLLMTGTGATTFGAAIGINGVSPPAQVTGWGTPTGGSVTANFSGSAAPLTTCSAAIAEIITALKSFGLFGA